MPGIIEFPQVVQDAVKQFGDLFANDALFGQRIALCFIGQPDPAPLTGPFIRVEALDAVQNFAHILRPHVVERLDPPGALQDFPLNFIQRAVLRKRGCASAFDRGTPRPSSN